MQFGEVQTVRLVKDIETGRSRGFGFVTFGSDKEAQKAQSMGDGEELDGRTMRINMSQPPVKRQSGGNRRDE